jgi:putative acyl-CoA dehydrogenase
MIAEIKKNPGLEEYDISKYKGAGGKNFYQEDKILQRIVARYTEGFSTEHKKAIQSHLNTYGDLVGGILNQLTEACHKEGKYGELQKYDRTGNRIDEIVYSPEQKQSRKISYDHGIVNLDFHPEWKFEFPHIHRYALAYLNNLNGEGGVSCPLAMTDGMILALKKIGTEDQKKKYLPLIAGPGSPSHFMCGQYVTERVGGSNVGANRTVAYRGENGKWILVGEKWFCSNPGDLWVTTAKIKGTQTIGMFLVSRWKEDGTLNNHHILRKKDIIGSRGKVTAEVIYDGVEAEELGRTAHGLANMIRYIIKTSRIHVGIGAAGNARRAIMEALEYARFRSAYGKKVLEFPAYYRLLVEMHVLHTVNLLANFRSIHSAEKEIPLQDLSIPLMKYKSSSLAADISRTAILCLGGNGIIGDFSPIPRMLNDSIINESWEGTHLIITEHCLHALSKPRVKQSFLEELHKNVQVARDSRSEHLNDYIRKFESILKEWENLVSREKDWKSVNRVYLIEKTYDLWGLSLVLEEAGREENEKKEPNGNNLDFSLILSAYLEILESGIQGPRDPKGAILDPGKSRRILASA